MREIPEPVSYKNANRVSVRDGQVLCPVGIEVADGDRAWSVRQSNVRGASEAPEPVPQKNPDRAGTIGNDQVLCPIGIEVSDNDRNGLALCREGELSRAK